MKLADAVDPPEEKPIDPHVALQKLIRLDRKHTNFDYVDSSRNVHFKVQYPCIFNDAPSNDHLLRQFWRHAHNYYFRSLQESQVGRLDYFASILNSKMPGTRHLDVDELPFRANTTFWKGLQAIFNPTYLQKQIKSAANDLDSQNWLCTLYLYNRLLDNQEGKSQKKLIKDLGDLKQAKSTIQHVTYQKRYKESLVVENKYLKNLLPVNQQYEDEVEQQIQRLTEQLQEKHQRTNQLLVQLTDRVRHQETQKNILYCFSNEQYDIPIKDPIKCKDQLILWDNINDIETQKQYLELCIQKLQKKQVAESLSKILKVEKFKNQSRFMVTFEEAMNVKKKIMTEKELLQLNKARQYSLFKFYNTSLKSPYSFICQNFLGFRQIYLNRNKPCKYKNKNILQEVKKSNHQPLQVSRGFEKFDICHHCKLLYPDNFLIKCKYTSQKMGIPIQPAPYVDPYITQISKIQTSPSQRYMIRRRNCYQNYTKNDEQYVCNRKFCKYCIRQNYQDGLDKNGLCPFCQGICFCTRCARNDMIVRLKSGQMSKLHCEKVLEIQNNETDEQETTSVRKKGRPKKVIRRTINSNVQQGERLGKIRMDLQPLRILCDMVKKRQKMKLRNLQTQIQLFHARVKIFNRDLNLDLQKQSTMKNNISNNPKENQKFNKKLKRMI